MLDWIIAVVVLGVASLVQDFMQFRRELRRLEAEAVKLLSERYEPDPQRVERDLARIKIDQLEWTVSMSSTKPRAQA